MRGCVIVARILSTTEIAVNCMLSKLHHVSKALPTLHCNEKKWIIIMTTWNWNIQKPADRMYTESNGRILPYQYQFAASYFLSSSTHSVDHIQFLLTAWLQAQIVCKKLKQIGVKDSGTWALDALSTPIWDKPFPVSLSLLQQNILWEL